MKSRTGSRVLKWGGAAILLVVAGVYGQLVYDLRESDPAYLVSCVDMNEPLMGWTCKQVLTRSMTEDQVKDLNAVAGASYVVMLEDRGRAAELLQLFVDKGVDVNAVESETKLGWTALHMAAMGRRVWPVELLLAHGARTDVRDREGLTPLDRARRAQVEAPETKRATIIRLLEAAGS